ncbi:hypothetical protein [Stenotrophomonas sp. PS02289]|uniref:hypothetical protein n=1 Tax=Stenotrophomonas sp. PS02289 TaxID=2991422 RepID=UPI00249BE6B2|nr:hypothetical protein [Stenotrophomonas sp. PS02289]
MPLLSTSPQMLARTCSFARFAGTLSASTSATEVVQQLQRGNVSPRTAALALQFATNRFSLNNWGITHRSKAANLDITSRQTAGPGLDDFVQALEGARVNLAKQDPKPSDNTVASMISLALRRCSNARTLWEHRQIDAYRDKDAVGIALASAVFGERHPDGVEAEAPPLPATPAPCRQIGSSHSRPQYPQDPSIAKLLHQRTFRSAPFQAFLKGMMGSSAA